MRLKPTSSAERSAGFTPRSVNLVHKCPIINRYFKTGLSQGCYDMAGVALCGPESLEKLILPSAVCRDNSTLLAFSIAYKATMFICNSQMCY